MARQLLPAATLDERLTRELHRLGGARVAGLRLHVARRTDGPDSDGCNWSPRVAVHRGADDPHAAELTALLVTIVAAARARFNLAAE